jgi:hypothetical protein
LILTNMLMLAAAAILAIVAALGHVDATMLLSLTVLLAVGAALNGPAWSASVPLTVPRRSLTQALVLNAVGFNIARARVETFRARDWHELQRGIDRHNLADSEAVVRARSYHLGAEPPRVTLLMQEPRT